jgi:multidrug resistance efflux pump
MSAALDRLKAEVAETKAGVESAKVFIAGLAQQIRDLVAAGGSDAEFTQMADDLDAAQADLAAAQAAEPQA